MNYACDSDDQTDVSDKSVNGNIGVTARESFAVNTITLIHRVNNAVPIRKFYRGRKPRKDNCALKLPMTSSRVSRTDF